MEVPGEYVERQFWGGLEVPDEDVERQHWGGLDFTIPMEGPMKKRNQKLLKDFYVLIDLKRCYLCNSEKFYFMVRKGKVICNPVSIHDKNMSRKQLAKYLKKQISKLIKKVDSFKKSICEKNPITWPSPIR